MTSSMENRRAISPAGLAYLFYSAAALAAVVGQVWVALRHIPFDDSWPVGLRVAVVLPFAACLELLGMATSALADERQRAGERAYGYRALSVAVALVAVGVIVVGHWPHAYEVAGFGALSAAAYVLWLLHSAARRRDALRAAGRLGAVAPAYGMARWVRHPIRTGRARELARERGLGLYASLQAADEQIRAEARRPAIAAAVEAVIRADHNDPRMAEIAARTLDPDKIAAELEARADYAGWAARLGHAVTAVPGTPGSEPARASGTTSGSPDGQASGTTPGIASGRPDRASGTGRASGRGDSGRASGRRPARQPGRPGAWDRAQAEREYLASVEAGEPLTPAELARRAGRDPKTAWRWIANLTAGSHQPHLNGQHHSQAHQEATPPHDQEHAHHEATQPASTTRTTTEPHNH